MIVCPIYLPILGAILLRDCGSPVLTLEASSVKLSNFLYALTLEVSSVWLSNYIVYFVVRDGSRKFWWRRVWSHYCQWNIIIKGRNDTRRANLLYKKRKISCSWGMLFSLSIIFPLFSLCKLCCWHHFSSVK